MSEAKTTQKYFSAAIVAVGLLFALDACYSMARPQGKEDHFQLEQSDVLNVLKAYRSEKPTPDVALLGSSLIEVPTIEAAAIAAKKPVDRLTHHHCDYLEKELAPGLGYRPNVMSLAVGGEMVSDAYLLTKRLLVGDRTPRAIIYGIGPRDFQDNLMPGVDSSDTFKVLSSLDDVPDLWLSRQLSPESKLTLTMENMSGFWGNRIQLASYTNQSVAKTLAPLFPDMKRSLSDAPKKTDVRTFIAGMIAPGQAVWHPDDEYMLQNYLQRYNPVAPAQIETQLGYFERLIKLCKERNIPIMIANMPLGEINRKVMAPGFYEKYLVDTRKICSEQNVPYVDLNDEPLTAKENFLDTVHLNPRGSALLFATMSKRMDPTIAMAIKDEHTELATKRSASDISY
ncbi:MAG TPA: hypothetical protein V6C89_03265 [Drouetiella sp.]|jgi:Protein of unknown function (DUF1574)